MSESISKIAVLGAGTMGRGIAHVSATGGFEACLFDVSNEILEGARKAIDRNLDRGVELRKVDTDDAEAAKERLTILSDLNTAVEDADLVIEAIPESMELKVKTFEELSHLTPQSCLFASNTSGLSISEMATASGRPDRFAGMHFFNPVHKMRLVELVRGLKTSDQTMAILEVVAGRMGKTVVTVNESPGFVTSRINALIGNEAFRMLEDGIASARDIDTALKLGLNHPMGPFEMVDLVGLDVRLSILRHLEATLGELYRPSPLLTQYVEEDRLGRKVGRGVYEYDQTGKIVD